MASRTRQNKLLRFGPGIKIVAGRFFPNGTSNDPLVVQTDGGVVSVVRQASAGVFLITFRDVYRRLLDWNLSVQHTTAVDLKPQLGDVANLAGTSPVTAVVRLLAVATATDMAGNANSSVGFSFTFQDSSNDFGDKP